MSDSEKERRQKEIAQSIIMMHAVVLMDNLLEALDALQETAFYAKDIKYRTKMLLDALENRIKVFYEALPKEEDMKEFVKHTSALKKCLNLVYSTATTDREDLANYITQFLQEIPASDFKVVISNDTEV